MVLRKPFLYCEKYAAIQETMELRLFYGNTFNILPKSMELRLFIEKFFNEKKTIAPFPKLW